MDGQVQLALPVRKEDKVTLDRQDKQEEQAALEQLVTQDVQDPLVRLDHSVVQDVQEEPVPQDSLVPEDFKEYPVLLEQLAVLERQGTLVHLDQLDH